jgi:MFS family permease
MPPLPTPVAADPRVGGHRPVFYGWWIVAAFAVTQTAGYGCLYYAFAVLLHPIAGDLRTSTTAVTGAITTALLAAAATAILVGRWLDRHGGRGLMTAGALTGAGLLAACSQVRTVWQLYAVFAGLGVAMAAALYEPATAVIVSWFDRSRRPKALLAMIVVAGFASTVFMPVTGQLEHRYGWRTTLLVLACVYAAIAVPLHAAVIRRSPGGPAGTRRSTVDERRTLVRGAVRDGRFWCLAVAFVAHGAAMSAMTVHLVGFLVRAGHPATFAATVAGLLGVLSVTGRLILTGAQRRVRLHRVVAVVFVVQSTAAISLPIIGGSRLGAVVAVTGFGIGFGVASLATPALLADRYGTAAYASIAGTLATPVTFAKAGAPLGAAALYTATGGYTPVLLAIGASSIVAAAGILARATSAPPHAAAARAGAGAGAVGAGSAGSAGIAGP